MLRNIELLEQALEAERGKNDALTEKLVAAQSATHKILRRFEAMEYRIAQQSSCIESGGDIAVTLEDAQRLQAEYQTDLAGIKHEMLLRSVKNKELDLLFEHFAAKCECYGIRFGLTVNGSIPYMIDHVIPQNKLETLVGDHLQDALTAVCASSNTHRAILVGIGLAGDCYEFTVSDNGIPFEPDTLMRLGTERVTTHAADGGTGIGFMTTFETMRTCGASLIIREKSPNAADYTKSVTIRFDGRNRYVIETYRPGEFPCDKCNGRYEVIDAAGCQV